MAMYTLARGCLQRYVPDGTYHGTWALADSGETPAVGDSVEYRRVGDNISGSFEVPEIGGKVRIDNVDWTEAFTLGAARFEPEGHVSRFRVETAVGDTMGSYRIFVRVK